MTCGICGEDEATELAILEGDTIAVHPECYDNQASMLDRFPELIASITRL